MIWQEAVEKYQHDWPYILRGETPPPMSDGEDDGCTLRALCEAFMQSKKAKLQAGDLSERSFDNYLKTTRRLVEHFGRDRRVDSLRPDDFAGLRTKLSRKLGPVSLRNEINHVRIVLEFAYDQGMVEKPVRLGQAFDRPSPKAIRKARNDAGPRMFEADELRTILEALDGNAKDAETGETIKADLVMKAMVLLGVNAGFGNTDVANLPRSAVDLESGWIDFPRPKTEKPRRVPLWPEPKDRADADMVFRTVQGNRYVRITPNQKQKGRYSKVDTVTHRFGRLLKRLGINGRRGLGFYTLRHVFETVAGECRDQVAVDAIMGHVDSSMAGQYRERISDERLRDAVETVRLWLWPPKKPQKNGRGRKGESGKAASARRQR